MSETRSGTLDDYRRRILLVLVHIQQNLDAALSLDELATVACFSPFHFHRVFRALVGESVRQHVRRLRLERAAQRLKHTDQPVTRIAFEAGYETHEAFTRAFHRSFDCSPSKFRADADATARIRAPAQVHFVAADAPESLAFDPLRTEEGMNVEIRTLEPSRVAFIRHVGPYDQVGDTWERLTDWMGAECLFGPDVKLFGMCWDDPEVTPADKIRYDACVTVDDSVAPTGEIGINTLPGGRYAVMLHEGPYDKLGDAYAALMGGWFPEQGLVPGDPPSMELYLNDPHSTEPEDLLTEICMPIHREA